MVVFVCSEDLSPVTNVLVEGIGDQLIGDEEGDRVSVWCSGGFLVDECQSLNNGEDVSLSVKLILSDVNGNDKMWSI